MMEVRRRRRAPTPLHAPRCSPSLLKFRSEREMPPPARPSKGVSVAVPINAAVDAKEPPALASDGGTASEGAAARADAGPVTDSARGDCPRPLCFPPPSISEFDVDDPAQVLAIPPRVLRTLREEERQELQARLDTHAAFTFLVEAAAAARGASADDDDGDGSGVAAFPLADNVFGSIYSSPAASPKARSVSRSGSQLQSIRTGTMKEEQGAAATALAAAAAAAAGGGGVNTMDPGSVPLAFFRRQLRSFELDTDFVRLLDINADGTVDRSEFEHLFSSDSRFERALRARSLAERAPPTSAAVSAMHLADAPSLPLPPLSGRLPSALFGAAESPSIAPAQFETAQPYTDRELQLFERSDRVTLSEILRIYELRELRHRGNEMFEVAARRAVSSSPSNNRDAAASTQRQRQQQQQQQHQQSATLLGFLISAVLLGDADAVRSSCARLFPNVDLEVAVPKARSLLEAEAARAGQPCDEDGPDLHAPTAAAAEAAAAFAGVSWSRDIVLGTERCERQQRAGSTVAQGDNCAPSRAPAAQQPRQSLGAHPRARPGSAAASIAHRSSAGSVIRCGTANSYVAPHVATQSSDTQRSQRRALLLTRRDSSASAVSSSRSCTRHQNSSEYIDEPPAPPFRKRQAGPQHPAKLRARVLTDRLTAHHAAPAAVSLLVLREQLHRMTSS